MEHKIELQKVNQKERLETQHVPCETTEHSFVLSDKSIGNINIMKSMREPDISSPIKTEKDSLHLLQRQSPYIKP